MSTATSGRPRRLPRGTLGSGPRAFLRRPTPADGAQLTAQVRRSRRVHRPYVSAPADPEAYAAYLTRLRRRAYAGYLVCERESREIAGVININEIVHGALQSGYLGYYVLVPFQGQGLMREGLELVLEHAFTRLGLHRLEANIQPQNRRSIALVASCGFRREGLSYRYLKVGGRWRDHERWAVLADEWRALRGVR